MFYTRDVINGTATLNINLDPGNYTITTMYGKYSVGIYGKNVKIKDSNISGYTCNKFIGSNISLELNDSVINYSAGLISAGNTFN